MARPAVERLRLSSANDTLAEGAFQRRGASAGGVGRVRAHVPSGREGLPFVCRVGQRRGPRRGSSASGERGSDGTPWRFSIHDGFLGV